MATVQRADGRRRHRRLRRVALSWVAAVLLAATACTTVRGAAPRSDTDRIRAEMGRDLMVEYGCGTCHTIPGVRGANALVGPPLTAFGDRAYIAGTLVNTEENLARWIRDPQSVEPGTVMPDLGVTEEEAASIAAYLHTLRAD